MASVEPVRQAADMADAADALPPLSLVVMGVSGVGKTSVARALVARTGWPFQEGDELHPEANVAKMAAGHPLDDDDRWPWLRRIADWVGAREAAGEGAVVTCSALKRSYRDLLCDGHPSVRFVHLVAGRDVLTARVTNRHDHYMPPSLLQSQLDALEPLGADEPGVVVETYGDPDAVAERALEELHVGRASGVGDR
jgi:gluconokinase